MKMLMIVLLIASSMVIFGESACSIMDRSAYQDRGATSIYTTVSLCYANNLNDPQLATNCISRALSISSGCSSCFVESATCSVENCFSLCKDGKDSSADCKSCFNLKCFPVFTKCAYNQNSN